MVNLTHFADKDDILFETWFSGRDTGKPHRLTNRI
jgi:hypothetical protein